MKEVGFVYVIVYVDYYVYVGDRFFTSHEVW
jgi:hypothetical protein